MAGSMNFILLAAAAFASNAIRGLTGLGSAVIFVPFASLTWTAAMALAVSAVLDLCGNSYLCWLNRRSMELPTTWWRDVGALTVGILLGSSFISLNDKLVRRLTGSLILLTIGILALLSKRSLPRVPEKYSTVVGFLVGIVSAVSGVPGPAVALMLVLQGKQKEIVRLTPPFLLVNSIVRIVGLAAVGRFSLTTASAAAAMVPFALVGVWGGQRFGQNLPFRQLKYLIIGVVAVSGVWMVAR